MAQDQQSYRRATNAALIGLIVQIILTATMWVLAQYAGSAALFAVAWYLIGGLPIWVILLLVYNQHRLERMESLEAEQLGRADAQTAAIFSEHAVDLQVARRRLDLLYKWGLPGVSLLVASYLLAIGIWLFYGNYSFVKSVFTQGQFATSTDLENMRAALLYPDINVAITALVAAVVAFLSFIYARYAAGMTKVADWTLLRGGAGFLVGSFALSGLGAASLVTVLFGSYTGMVLATVAIPAIITILGAEIILSQLLSAYRPRRPGEVPRPGFDSRILGLLTSPKSLAKALSDAINYQFGFEVSRSWFYQLLSKAITPLIVTGVAILFLVSCFVVVEPDEQALILRNGNIVRVLEPGPYLKLPWPIDVLETYPAGRIIQINVGSAKKGIKDDTPILWTTEHSEGGKEEYLVCAPTPVDVGSSQTEGGRTPSNALIGGQISVQARVLDLKKSVRAANRPVDILMAISEACFNRYVVTRDIDTLLGPDRTQAGERLRKQIQADADAMDLGLEVVFVGMIALHPPSDKGVASAFHEQIGVLQERESALAQAQKDAIQTLSQVVGSRDRADAIIKAIDEREQLLRENVAADKLDAHKKDIEAKESQIEALLTASEGKAAELLYAAHAYRWEKAVAERGKAERFSTELAAFRKAPDLYRSRRFMEVLASEMTKSRKFVLTAGSADQRVFRFDFKEAQTNLSEILKTGN